MKELLSRFLFWRVKNISNRNFILLLAGVIGAVSGLAAVTLKEAVHLIHKLLRGGFEHITEHLYFFTFPLIGILITVIISRYLLKERLGHGISQILFDITQNSSVVKARKMWSRMVTSAFTVGFGGSVGLEAPIVVTGSAIGSNIGNLMHQDYRRRTLLIGCGAAGAIAGIFNSPVAGVIFSIEVILSDITISAFIPLLIASVAGNIVSLALLGDDVLFSFKGVDPFKAQDTPFYILLGIVAGLVSLYFTRMVYRFEPLIKRIKNYALRGATGGAIIGIMIFVFPPLFGEGYDTIKNLLDGQEAAILRTTDFFNDSANIYLVLFFLFAVLLLKPIAVALTIGAGGSGGIFAPSLFLGGVTGFLFAKTSNLLLTEKIMSLSNFTLVGMCGVMSGVLHAPLTAIFLIAEITSGYTLFIPLMLVSAISYVTISYFEKYSIYTKKLIERGQFFQDDKDLQVLNLIDLSRIIEKDLHIIHPNAKLDDLVKLVKKSRRNIFPVVDEKQVLRGIITLDDIRDIMFDEEARQTILIYEIMHSPPASVSTLENMQSVMHKFESSGAWNLPVIEAGKYIGFVSKSRIFNAYRNKLISQYKM